MAKKTQGKKKTGSPAKSKPKSKRIAIEKISDFGKTLLQDCFQVELLKRFKTAEVSRIIGRDAISNVLTDATIEWHKQLEQIAKKNAHEESEDFEHSGNIAQMLEMNPDSRHFILLMRWLYEGTLLEMAPRTDDALAKDLSRSYRDIPCEVVASKVKTQFAFRAAQVFLERLQRHGNDKWRNDSKSNPLNIGLVSGSTVESVVEILEGSDNWERDFGVNASRFGHINVIAVNVCLTDSDGLNLNANILVYRLVRAMKAQLREKSQVNSFGLSAPLTVDESDLQDIDNGYETRKVIEITQPFRLRDSSCAEEESFLDIILTSVGSRESSLFLSSSKELRGDEYKINVEQIESGMAGDIIYTPVNSRGEEMAMIALVDDPDNPGKKKKEKIIFYSAINLKALKHMATKRHEKSVILLARGKEKSTAVKAALTGEYASVLVTDSDCAEGL